MITSDYNIVSPDMAGTDWSSCRIVLELNRRFFHYTILQGENTVMALKYYSITPTPERGAVELLEDIIAGDELLNKNIKVSAVIYNMPENHLVPEEFYDERSNSDLISLIHGNLRKDIILSEKIRNTGMYNIYLIPAPLHRFLDQKFAPAQYSHFYSLWIEWRLRQQNETADSVHVMFYPNEILVMLMIGNKVELVQTFIYDTSEDVSYHLLNIYNQYHLPTNDLPLKVSGMLVTDSAMYEELLKYFMLVETVPAPEELSLAPDFDQFPPHFFSPILKMAVCV